MSERDVMVVDVQIFDNRTTGDRLAFFLQDVQSNFDIRFASNDPFEIASSTLADKIDWVPERNLAVGVLWDDIIQRVDVLISDNTELKCDTIIQMSSGDEYINTPNNGGDIFCQIYPDLKGSGLTMQSYDVVVANIQKRKDCERRAIYEQHGDYGHVLRQAFSDTVVQEFMDKLQAGEVSEVYKQRTCRESFCQAFEGVVEAAAVGNELNLRRFKNEIDLIGRRLEIPEKDKQAVIRVAEGCVPQLAP